MEIIMLTIIKQKQPLPIIKCWLVIGTLSLILILLTSCNSSDYGQDPSEKYDTITGALQAYYLCQRDTDITEEELSEMTLNSFAIDENYFYLMKEYTKVEDKKIPYVYVLGVGPAENKWFCEKATADFSLASLDGVNDADYTPYAEYEIPISDKILHVGIVFDDNYTPAINGERLFVDVDGIYSYLDNSNSK